MRILVCVKQVPDTTEAALSSDFTLQRDFVAQVMNPADESALELALRLRNVKGSGTDEVVCLSMSPERAENMLREALARGADKAVLLTDRRVAGADTLVTAECLKAAMDRLGGFDLVLCGRRASDGETGQVGPMLAAMNGLPCVSNAVSVSAQDGCLLIGQLTENGTVTWKSPLPALVTLCEWCYRLRLPTVTDIKKARAAQITRYSPDDLGLSACGIKASPTRVVKISARQSGARPCKRMTAEAFLNELGDTLLMPRSDVSAERMADA